MNFGQLITAMITPFDRQGDIDFKEVKRIARKLADEGSDGIVVTGTTGESPTLTHEEDLMLYAAVLEEVGDRVKVIAGTGSNSTATSIHYTKLAQSIGCHGAMLVVPYYNKPSQEGMVQHFLAVAEATSLPMMLYNIPGRTGVNMLPETVIRITEKAHNYVAIKECSGNLDQMSQIMEMNRRKDFKLYTGDDAFALDVVKRGGYGVVSVASHVVGRDIIQMLDAWKSGKTEKAEALNAKLSPLFKVLFITSNPSPVK